MEKIKIPGFTGVDTSTSDIDSPGNKLLHSENFILSQKYGNARKRPGSVRYSITGDIWGIGGYATSTASFSTPVSVTPIRYRVASSTPYVEKLDWAKDGDLVNFFTYSEQLDNAAWAKVNTTVTANSVVAPDGATTADTLTCSAGTSQHYFYPNPSPAGLATGGRERVSVYLKKGNHRYIGITNYYGQGVVIDFDTETTVPVPGTYLTTDNVDYYAMEGDGAGWYRITLEYTKFDSGTRQIYVGFRTDLTATGGIPNYSAAGTETVYVWGMQANDYYDLPTYVQTTSAAVETPAWTPMTINSDVSSLLATNGIARTAQVGEVMALFAGTPAMIDDLTAEVRRLGGDAPATAPTIAATAAAGALTGTYTVCYTFYDSTSGWESSPSPISNEITIAAKNIDWSGLATSTSKDGVDRLRLYRTESSGEQVFYLVDEVAIGSSTYLDVVTTLTTQAPEIGSHNPPPSGAYIGEAYANRLWTTDGQYSLRFSEAYDGNFVKLQYFPSTNEISFNQKITGIRASERLGGLLVFKAPGFGVDLIRGLSTETFEVVQLYSDMGTNYDSSITVVGDDVCFWGQSGPEVIRNGVLQKYFSKPLEDKLKDLVSIDYNMSSFVWSFWHPYYKQVFWGVSAYSSTGSGWVELSSSLFADWEVLSTGAPYTTWEDYV